MSNIVLAIVSVIAFILIFAICILTYFSYDHETSRRESKELENVIRRLEYEEGKKYGDDNGKV